MICTVAHQKFFVTWKSLACRVLVTLTKETLLYSHEHSNHCTGKGKKGERKTRFQFACVGGKEVVQTPYPLGPGPGAGQAAWLG